MFQEKQQFKTRSGRVVKVGEDGTLMFDHVNGYLTPESALDAEEFYEAKRDADRGRWRWPENRNYVVYPNDGVVIWTLDELTGVSHMNTREGLQTDQHGDAARAYFEAHPVRRAWADAEVVVWQNGAYLPQIAQRDLDTLNRGWWWCDDPEGGRWRSEDELARVIGAAEVRGLAAMGLDDTDGARR